MWSKVRRYFKYLLIPVPNPQKWLFIAGCPNSGTTLLHHLLASHPSIASMPQEGQFLTDQLIKPYALGLSRTWAQEIPLFYLDEKTNTNINIRKLKKQWALHYNDLARPVLMEKSPTNTLRLKWLQRHFLNASFIGIYRNGYAVSKGIALKSGCSIDLGIQQWIKSNEILFKDIETMNHKLLIRYEDLTEQPEDTLRKITDFLSIAPLSEEQIHGFYTIQGKSRSIQNLNKDRIEQLTQEEIQLINSQASTLLNQLNYKLL